LLKWHKGWFSKAGLCRAFGISVLPADLSAAKALSLTLSLFVTTRRLTIDTTYVPVPRSKKRKLQSIPESIQCIDHTAEVTPVRESSSVHMPAKLQHLDIMDTAMSDGIRLGETPVTETIEFFDVSHGGKLVLPCLMIYRITADTILLLYPNRGVPKLILDLRRHIKT